MTGVLNHKIKQGTWLCCAVASLLLGLQQARAESAVGVVSKVAGTVRIVRAGAKLAVTNGTAVLPWDNLTAAAQSSLTITFNKGGAVALEGPLEFLVDVSDNLEPMNSRPAELLRKLSGQSRVSTFRASAMGLRAERTQFAFESFGAIGGLHPRRKRERVGTASQVMGIVHVTKPSSIAIVKEGTPIDAGDELTTDTGASLRLIMDDGSALDLGDRTQFAAGILTDPPDPELLRDRSSFSSNGGQRLPETEQALPGVMAPFQRVDPKRQGGGEGTQACDQVLQSLDGIRRNVNGSNGGGRYRLGVESNRKRQDRRSGRRLRNNREGDLGAIGTKRQRLARTLPPIARSSETNAVP